MSLNTPKSSIIPSPVLLDAAIQNLQQAFIDPTDGLSWLTYAFGRGRRRTDADGKRYPEVWQGDLEKNQDYWNCLPNDKFQSFCFFYVTGPDTGIQLNYPAGSYYANREVRIIFFVDLFRINPSKTYIFTEELKEDVLVILRNKFQKHSTINNYYDTINDAYDGFSLDLINEQYYDNRYQAMRFDLTLSYRNEC